MTAIRKYKPLLFTTTVRNPSRLKAFLYILKKHNQEILTDNLAEKIMGEIIKYGLYRPTRASNEIINKWGSKKITDKSPIGKIILSDKEVFKLIKENPQKHKEAGFEKGWPSRFATEFDMAKEFGFVYYKIGEAIKFSKIGKLLSDAVEIKLDGFNILYEEKSEFEQQAFLQALTKYQRNNPFVKVKNENAPLILLLEVIKKINADPELNGCGISKLELPLLIFWKNNDANELYTRIKRIRKKYGLNPSSEVIIDICINEIMEGEYKKFKDKSILIDYPDEFIRKMRLTGLISFRGGGRFIDINNNEIKKVNYIIQKYSHYLKFEDEKDYFNYVAEIDNDLISIETRRITLKDANKKLQNWTNIYSWSKIKEQLVILSKKSSSKDDVLKYLPAPIRLEFLISLAIKSKYPEINVVPNYSCDDEGIPTCAAGGNKGDIECYKDDNGALVEVTMSEGRTQTVTEIWPIERHLKDFIDNNKYETAICYFIAPSIYSDSKSQIDYVKDKKKMIITPKTILEFIEYIEIFDQDQYFCGPTDNN